MEAADSQGPAGVLTEFRRRNESNLALCGLSVGAAFG